MDDKALKSTPIFVGMFESSFKIFYLVQIFIMLLIRESQAQIIAVDSFPVVYTINLNDAENLIDSLVSLDTSLNRFHNRHGQSINNTAIQNSGMAGTPYRSLELNQLTTPFFNSGLKHFNAYHFGRLDQIQLSGKPFTDLHYVQGYPQMIYLKADHAQKLGEFASFGIHFRRLKMQNIYYGNIPERNRIPNIYNTAFDFRFDSPDKRYLGVVSLTFNRINIRETGGLSDEEKFDALSPRSRLLNSSARYKNASNDYRDFSIQVRQFFQPDGKVNDSLYIRPRIRFYSEFEIGRTKSLFKIGEIPDSLEDHYYFSTATLDSNKHWEINERLGLAYRVGQHLFKAGIKQESNWLRMIKSVAAYSGFFSQFVWNFKETNFNASVELDAGFMGYNNGDLYLHSYFDRHFLKVFNFGAVFDLKRVQPGFNSRYFVSNHFLWNHPEYRKTLDKNAEIYIHAGKKNFFRLIVAGGILDQFVFFNQTGYPQQLDKSLGWYKVSFQSEYKWKVLGNRNQLVWQNSDSRYLPYPNYVIQSALFAQGKLFKGNMLLQIGLDLNYYSKYEAPRYNPITRQFQIFGKKEYGNYPQTDIYINAQIKTVSLTATWQNANQGLYGDSYILSPGYPNLPRSFNFGIRWRLFN